MRTQFSSLAFAAPLREPLIKKEPTQDGCCSSHRKRADMRTDIGAFWGIMVMTLVAGSWILALCHERMKKREADGEAFGHVLEAALHSGRVNGHQFTDADVLHERPLLSTEYPEVPNDYTDWKKT
jgi:hypothetical protein